jgi:hypothetical protein
MSSRLAYKSMNVFSTPIQWLVFLKREHTELLTAEPFFAHKRRRKSVMRKSCAGGSSRSRPAPAHIHPRL